MKYYLLPLLLITLSQSLRAQTNVSGYILSNTTWTLANSPYIVTGNILVNNGVTLTIEPGVTVQLDTTKSLQIDGELIAVGNAQNRITFTATDTTPARGSWGRIQFSPNSTDAVFDTSGNYISGSILKYCDIRYGGGVPGDVTVYCDTSAPYFSNCRISDCLKHAVYFVNAVGRVDSSSIRNCGGTAISYVSPVAANLIVINDTLEDNGGGIIRSANGSFTNTIVRDCIFTNSGKALVVGSSTNTIISDNVFTANLDAIQGGLGANVNIVGNIFIGQTNSVIGSSACSSHYNLYTLTATNLTIIDNHIENNKGAIYVVASYCVIQGNIFRNNQFDNEIPCSCGGQNCGPGNCFCEYTLIKTFNARGAILNNVFDGNTNTQTHLYSKHFISISGVWEIANNLFNNNSPSDIYCNGKANICSNKFLSNSGKTISCYGSMAGAFIHDNEFTNNSDDGSIVSVSNNSVISNNEFRGNSCTGATIISITAGSPLVRNNRFISNLNFSCPIISITASSNANIHNNDFLDNSGLSGLRISGNTLLSIIEQNNFVNPDIQYEIENQIPFGPGANFNISNNYWGTTDTAHIDSVIKDYFDDANLSVALYLPVLTAPAFVDTNASCTSVVCSLSVSGTVVNASCYGGGNGSINITVSNGTIPYSYVWSNGGTGEDRSNLISGNYTITVIDANFCSATKSFSISQPSSPVAVVSGVVSNANCNTGGTINIAAGGGTSPYTYNWGSSIITQNRTGLNPGNYSVTVKDNNNCTATQSFTVGQDAGPIISRVVTNASCHNGCDGSINVSVTGIAPFTYNWGNGLGASEDTSGLCAGTYNVTVADSNNCGIATSFTIISPAALVASASITNNVSCFGFSDGAATATANGGTSPYSFLWSNGQTAATATGLSAGVYAVTSTDSVGCTASASVTIPDGYNVFAGAIGGAITAGINQSTTYIVSANPNYSYDWNTLNGIILSGQGTNSIEVAWTSAGTGLVELIAQEQGCSDTVSKSVTITDTTQNCSALFYLYPDTIPHSYFVINTASGIPQLSYS